MTAHNLNDHKGALKQFDTSELKMNNRLYGNKKPADLV